MYSEQNVPIYKVQSIPMYNVRIQRKPQETKEREFI